MTQPLQNCINCSRKKKHESDYYFEQTGKRLCADCCYLIAEEVVLDGEADTDDFI